MKIYKVYCHTINNKKYIGYTEKDIEKRLEEHIKDSIKGSDTYFHRAIRKYGSSSIKTEKLYECFTEDEAKNKEIYYINCFDTYKNGYNMTPGGSGGNTKSKYSKIKMKKWSKNRKKLSSGMNNGNAKPDISKNDIVEEIVNFIKRENKIGKNILRKEIDKQLKEKLNISSRMLINRGINNHLELIRLVNEKLVDGHGVLYDPFYRSPSQRKNASYLSSKWSWVTDGAKNIRIKEEELMTFLQKNNTYKRGRTI
jgi:group I intron endonuclease